jgi:L-ribulose-5-phosphate 3-epimerase
VNPLLYNTNGFASHRLEDAARVLAELGYDGLALTPDVHHLDPFGASPAEVAAFRRLLGELSLSVAASTAPRSSTRRSRPPSGSTS